MFQLGAGGGGALMEGKGTLESGGKAQSLTLHGRAMPYARGQAELCKALTSGGCQQDAPWEPKGLEAVPAETEKEGKAKGETQVQVSTTPWPQPHQSPGPAPCCVHAHQPLLGLQRIRQDNPGDLLQA